MSDDLAIERLRLETADGISLEAELVRADPARAAVVLAHPHPAQGGTMQSLVTSELFRLLPPAGMTTLRFNFRGVGASGGSHGQGRREHLDVEAAIDHLHGSEPALPLVVAGWSFGADVALSVVHPALAGWVLIAPPLRVLPRDELVAAHDDRPKLLVVPEHDQFNPPEEARPAVADWTNTELEVVASADHFFAGRTTQVADLVELFVREHLAAPAG